MLGVYFLLDPAQHFFPKCPFFWATGWKCPGCGSQRAIHQLLNANIPEAMRANFLLVLASPYVIFGLVLEYTSWREKYASVRRKWYGRSAAWAALAVVLVFWLARNVWGF